MSRGRASYKKKRTEPDPMYSSILLSKFINRMMRGGKKTVSQKVVYKAFDIIREKGSDPLKVFEAAVDNVGPKQEVRARRIGGAAYQVPSEVRGERRVGLAIRWILAASKKRSNSEFKTFSDKLAAEFLAASNNEGEAIRKRDVTYRMAEANKAFAHFRW